MASLDKSTLGSLNSARLERDSREPTSFGGAWRNPGLALMTFHSELCFSGVHQHADNNAAKGKRPQLSPGSRNEANR